MFAKRNADWISELPPVIKKINNKIHNSTKMTLFQASGNQMKKMSIQISDIIERKIYQSSNLDN